MSDHHPHIIFAEPFNQAAVDRMSTVGRVTELHTNDENTLLQAVSDCDALLVHTSTQVTRHVIEHAERLRVIGRGGVGLDNIDVEAAKHKGIAVVYTPQAGTDAVADLTVGLMISLVRNINECDQAVRLEKHFEFRAKQSASELHELTLGIIGMGRIGRAVSSRCHHGFGLKIIYNDIIEPLSLNFPATRMEKEQLYRESDIISLHVPLTDQTTHLINEKSLSQFKDNAYLINTARGAVVDTIALAKTLQSGKLSGAALDVFDPEPLPSDHPMMHAPHTIFSPHIGARTQSSLARMDAVVEDVIRVLHGEDPEFSA